MNLKTVYDLIQAHSALDVPGRVVRCAECGMWFKILADPNGIPESYPGEYGEDEIAATYLLGATARQLFRATLAGLDGSRLVAHPRLLDVGAGQGALVEEATRLGFDAEGIDHCASNVEAARAKGRRVRHAAAEDLEERDAFDVITMMDIIEHVPDPVRLLRAAYRALKPGGELVVYTPNHRAAVVTMAKLLGAVGVTSPIREIFGRNHVAFFDDRTLPLALRRAGFENAACHRFRYDVSRPGQDVSALTLAVVSILEWLGTPFGRVFRLIVYARKPLDAGPCPVGVPANGGTRGC